MEHDFRAVVPNFLKSNQVIIAQWLAWRLASGELPGYIDPQTNTYNNTFSMLKYITLMNAPSCNLADCQLLQHEEIVICNLYNND